MKLFKKTFIVIIGCFAFLIFLASCSGNKNTNNSSNESITYHNVTFMNSDGTILEKSQVQHGGYAIYTGPTPTKESTEEFTYEFEKFSPDPNLVEIYKDTTFVAIFKNTVKGDLNNGKYTNVNLFFEKYNGGYKITKCTSIKYKSQIDQNTANGILVLPSEYEGLPVVSIGDHAFSDTDKFKSFTSIKFPSQLNEIGYDAFCFMNFTSLTFPASLRKINEWAFRACKKLNSINFNNGLVEIGEDAFLGTNLTNVRIPSSVSIIGKGAFSGGNDITFYCEASSKPSGWDKDWHLKQASDFYPKYHENVIWGA